MRRGVQRRGEQGGILVNLVVLLSVATLCALVYFVRHPIMRYGAESWVVDEPAPHADAIVVLSDDNFYADRATRATELYRQGVAGIVVASGRRLRPNAGLSELMEHDLVERGVPKDKILRFAHDADSTSEEAAALAHFAEEHKWKSIVVVTSNYHTRRARWGFRSATLVGEAGIHKAFCPGNGGYVIGPVGITREWKRNCKARGEIGSGSTGTRPSVFARIMRAIEKTNLALYSE